MTAHWISCRLFTVQVTTDENSVIVWAAPIVRKFTGQPLDHLLRWARKQGGQQGTETP